MSVINWSQHAEKVGTISDVSNTETSKKLEADTSAKGEEFEQMKGLWAEGKAAEEN